LVPNLVTLANLNNLYPTLRNKEILMPSTIDDISALFLTQLLNFDIYKHN
jgi:hypothetical protein